MEISNEELADYAEKMCDSLRTKLYIDSRYLPEIAKRLRAVPMGYRCTIEGRNDDWCALDEGCRQSDCFLAGKAQMAGGKQTCEHWRLVALTESE